MKAIALLTVLALAAPGTPRADGPARGSGFEMTLERDGAVWKAACATGCEWREVRYECLGQPCNVTLDAHGIGGAAAGSDADAAFAFVLSPTEAGWKAETIRGTGWTKLSWGCTLRMFCRARVDQSGVRPGWI